MNPAYASVQLRDQNGRATRIASLASGTVLGEFALLDSAPRSATVLADDELASLVLTEAAFHSSRRATPRAGYCVLWAWVGQRVRAAPRDPSF